MNKYAGLHTSRWCHCNVSLNQLRESKLFVTAARVDAVGWGTAQLAGRSRVRFPMVSLEFFHWHNPSARTMVLGSTQPLTVMSTRHISWGVKVAGAWGWLYLHVPTIWNLGASASWHPQGLSRPVMGLVYLFVFYRPLINNELLFLSI
jgi:hypothetical protein